MQKQILPARSRHLTPSHYRENLPPKRPRRRLLSLFKEWIMQNTTQPIDRASLLIEANKLIRDHEDTLAGIEATAWNNVTACWYSAANTSLTNKGYPPRKAPPCSICLNTWRTRFQRNITWSINAKREALASRFCLQQRFLSALQPAE